MRMTHRYFPKTLSKKKNQWETSPGQYYSFLEKVQEDYFWDLLIISISGPCFIDLLDFHKCHSLSCGILSPTKSSGLSQFLASVTSRLPILTFSLNTLHSSALSELSFFLDEWLFLSLKNGLLSLFLLLYISAITMWTHLGGPGPGRIRNKYSREMYREQQDCPAQPGQPNPTGLQMCEWSQISDKK